MRMTMTKIFVMTMLTIAVMIVIAIMNIAMYNATFI